jgi:hypothetical protein
MVKSPQWNLPAALATQRAVAAYALDSIGERMGHVDVVREGEAVGIALTADASWYGVVLTR